jgi:hypothetical protein
MHGRLQMVRQTAPNPYSWIAFYGGSSTIPMRAFIRPPTGAAAPTRGEGVQRRWRCFQNRTNAPRTARRSPPWSIQTWRSRAPAISGVDPGPQPAPFRPPEPRLLDQTPASSATCIARSRGGRHRGSRGRRTWKDTGPCVDAGLRPQQRGAREQCIALNLRHP